MSWTLWSAALVSMAAAMLYLGVGRTVGQRRTSLDTQIPAAAFAAWWYGLSATTLLSAARLGMGAVGIHALPAYSALGQLTLIAACFSLGALLYHLIYLYTGSIGMWKPLALFYLAYAFVLLYYVSAADAIGIEIHRWTVRTTYATEGQRGVVFQIIVALLVLPQVFAAFGYFLLYFRVRDRAQRFRIAVVSWSLIVWFLATYLAALARFAETDAWQLMSRGLGMLAAAAILLAYRPPAWIKRRLQPTVRQPGASPILGVQ